MFIHLAIHLPKSGKAELVIDSMHRFGAAIKAQPGLQQVYTLRDQKSDRLVGLALWNSKEDFLAARPAMMAATQNDPFDEWEDNPPEVLHLEVV
jgi:heme-degrading monooxygenase HmoA